MIDYESLPTRSESGAVHAVIESPRGSGVKFKYDNEMRVFTIARVMVEGLHYPFDWGFVPSTKAPDGDPLDIMVLFDRPTYPGVVIACRPVGVLEVTQKKSKGRGRERNDRVVAIVDGTLAPPGVGKGGTMTRKLREQLALFFTNTVAFEDKELALHGWGDARAAERLVDRTSLARKKP